LAKTPHSPPRPISPASRIILGTLLVVWLIAVVGGGSARADVLYLVGVRFAAIAGLAVLLLAGRPELVSWRDKPIWFLLLFALFVAIQLVPLPYGLWTSLPGRQIYEQLSMVPEIGRLSRPISLAPDLTWNSLLSVLPPLFFLVAVPMVSQRYRRWLLIGLLVTILLSALLGLLQLAGGPQSNLRWYQFSNTDSASGFFANRNHEAAFLAMGIPLTVWWTLAGGQRQRLLPRLAIAASIIFFLLIAVVTSQSRMGLVVTALSLLLSAVYFVRHVQVPKSVLLGMAAAFVVAGLLTAWALTSWSVGRLSYAGIEDDIRLRILPESLVMLRTFFPWGVGFGAFPNAFTRFESYQDLSPEYVNHTHSELTQILIEGGIVSAILLALALIWCLVAFFRVWRRHAKSADQAAEARLATILITLPLVASITDYPIRAPLMACTLAIAVAILNQAMQALRREAAIDAGRD
jgi:O-antigen ligase